MTQIEAMIVAMSIGVFACWVITFLPDNVSFFRRENARIYFGVAVSTLLLNLWPLLSSEVLINKKGDEIYPFPFAYFSVLIFFFFVYLAIRAEKKD